jgi:hypothetical protein
MDRVAARPARTARVLGRVATVAAVTVALTILTGPSPVMAAPHGDADLILAAPVARPAAAGQAPSFVAAVPRGVGPVAAVTSTPAPIGLAVDVLTPDPPGATAPQLRARVTNLGPRACGLAATDLTISVLSATHDGQPIVPDYTLALPIDGATGALSAHTATVAPGAGIAFDLDTGFDALSSTLALDDGTEMAAQWQLQAAGHYQLQLSYAMPPAAFAPVTPPTAATPPIPPSGPSPTPSGAAPAPPSARPTPTVPPTRPTPTAAATPTTGPTPATTSAACAGSSDPVTIEFTIGAPSSPTGGFSWWIIGAVAVVIIVLAVVLLLVWLRARRHRGGGGATTTAAAVALLLLGGMGALAIDAVTPRPAFANVIYGPDPLKDEALFNQFEDCIVEITGYDPGLIKALQGTQVVVDPFPDDTFTTKFRGTDKIGILWNPDDHLPFVNDPGVTNDPCAALYHELNHARDIADGNDNDKLCDDTGIPIDEVAATLAENGFRASRIPPLPKRTTYDGYLLPPGLEACFPPPTQPGQRFASNDPPVCRGLDGPCASYAGDPHLATFDHYRYDLQAVGELVAAHSSAGDMDIQVRQSPYETSRTIAVNTAVAMKVAGIRLGFYLDHGVVVVHQDGAVTQFPLGTSTLASGVRVNRVSDPVLGDSYAIVWPDQSVAWVTQNGPLGLSLYLAPRAARNGTLTGTLGTFNGDPSDDLTTADGTRLSQPPSFDDLYHTFAASWRVTDANSLFDYVPGTSTKTFTDLTFPERPATAGTLPQTLHDSAAQACALLGVTDVAALADCILDVATTGQAMFAVQAQRVQAATPTVGSSSGGPTTTLTVSAGKALMTFTGSASQIAYVQVTATTLPNGCSLSLTAPNGKVVALGCISNGTGDIDGTKLPVTGTYKVTVSAGSTVTGTITLRVILSTDSSAPITVNGPSATATVTAAGQRVYLTFHGTAGEKVFVDILAGTVAPSCGNVSLQAYPGGLDYGLGCTGQDGTGYIDTTTLPTDGLYAVVLDPPLDHLGSITVKVTSVTDQHQSITVDGPAVTGTVTRPGAQSFLTFNASAGEKLTLDFSGASTDFDGCGTIALTDATNRILDLGCITSDGTGSMGPETVPATGTYMIVINPAAAATGSVTVRLHT